MALEVGQLELRSATIEVRYPTSLLIWDHSGRIWNEVAKKFPELTAENASPNDIKVQMNEKVTGVLAIDRSLMTATRARRDLTELKDAADVFFPILIEGLEVEAFTRVGFRVEYGKRVKSREEAAAYILETTKIHVPTGKQMNVAGHALDPEIAFRYEDDHLGWTARLKAQQAKININLPIGFEDLKADDERHFVIYDIDYYSHSSVPTAAFDGRAIIEDWLHLINRDSGKIFHG